ncbi:MAG: proton-conducting transporter membrane subunit, partial [Planctomycetaceae bacterium]
ELVGLSSALLVAFYHDRLGPVSNGLHVWSVYRFSDAALLLASVVLHHLTGEGDFDQLFRTEGNWPFGTPALASDWATIVGFLLAIAAAGKSALIPFSGWLPRAMEGPTPSSAVFYGALSVHLGAYLLLRVSPLMDASPLLCAALVVLGLLTSAHAVVVGRAQTDIKTALTYASMTQVGLIVAEIGMGFRYLALAHILGHACWRTLQFLRAPTFLHDQRILENATAVSGGNVPHHSGQIDPWIPPRFRDSIYRLALTRGRLDIWLVSTFANPFLGMFRKFDLWETRLANFLDQAPPLTDAKANTSSHGQPK